MPELTMGSLFDGIGVFPLAASRHGIVPISELAKVSILLCRVCFGKYSISQKKQKQDRTKL